MRFLYLSAIVLLIKLLCNFLFLKAFSDSQLWLMKLQEKLEMELKKHTDEAACKVAAVLQRAEEQGRMIESLHTSVSFLRPIFWSCFTFPWTCVWDCIYSNGEECRLVSMLIFLWCICSHLAFFFCFLHMNRLLCTRGYMKRNISFIHLIPVLQMLLQVAHLILWHNLHTLHSITEMWVFLFKSIVGQLCAGYCWMCPN